MMKRFLTENLAWKLLSILLSFLLWVVVAREPELATSISAPILFRNIPKDLDLASDVPERVQLEVRGPAPRLTPASLSQAAVVLDLSDLQPGEQTFTIHDRNIRQLPIGVMFFRAVPSQVSMRFERLISKDVPIEPAYERSPPEGYSVTSYRFDPPKVRIRGPESRVRNIDYVKTDPIDISGIVSEASRRAHVRVGDPQVHLESSPQVQCVVTLQKLPNKDSN